MIIPSSEFQLVVNRRMRRRVLVLPVRYGRYGERKKPLRVGGVYDLRPATRYDEWKGRSREQPTRARAVLWLIDRCLSEPKPVKVTVLPGVTREGDSWLVPIARGDHSAAVKRDAPIFMARSGDYTMASSLALDTAEVMLVPGAAERARVMALAARQGPQVGAINRATKEVETLQGSMLSMKARSRARLIAKELAKLRSELPVAEAVCSAMSDRAASQAARSLSATPGACGSDSVVSSRTEVA